jgi:hypothetical protein
MELIDGNPVVDIRFGTVQDRTIDQVRTTGVMMAFALTRESHCV